MSKQVTVDKKEICSVLSGASKFFPKKSTIPILETFKFEVTPTSLKVVVSNKDASIERSIPIMGVDTFEACLEKTIMDMINKCPNGNITLEFFEPTGVRITAGKAVFYTQTLDSKLYPALPETAAENEITLEAGELEEMLKAVEFAAASPETTQKILTAVNFSLESGTLNLTAIDGHRLATRSKTVNASVDVKMNIPPISRFIKAMDPKDSVKVSWDNNHIILTTADSKVVCRLIEGTYLNAANLLKMDNSSTVHVNKTSLMESLERAALLVSKEQGAKKPVILDIDGEFITIKLEDAKAKFEELVSSKNEGKALKIGFNVSLVIEALAKIAEENIRLLFAGPKQPVIIKGDNSKESEDYAYLVMPVNTHA